MDTRAKAPIARAGLALENEFNAIVASLDGDVAGRAAGDRYLANTHALYHGQPLSWALTPKIFSAEGAELLRSAAQTMGAIMAKVTRAFASDAKVRAAFGLEPAVEELCCLPTGYSCPIPLARVDIFLNEESGDFWFCELNTDGSAGMTAAMEVTRAIQHTESYRVFAERHHTIKTFDIVKACANALLATYEEWEGRGKRGHPSERPVIGVADYGESISADEVDHFIEHFAERGICCRFSEIRELKIVEGGEGARLEDKKGPIDLLWRRVVLSEMIEKPCLGAQALARAQKEALACVVGGFCTWPCATKTVFCALRDPALEPYLTKDDKAFIAAHVPWTEVLGPTSDLCRFCDKDQWIVKPKGGYNAQGVVAGLDVAPKAWQEVLLRGVEQGCVIQRFAPQFYSPVYLGGVLPVGVCPTEAPLLHHMEGLFLFRGRFGGVFTRCGGENTIGEWTDRLNMGCLVVDDRPGSLSQKRKTNR